MDDINKNQSTVWNHGEVFVEPFMRSQAHQHIAQQAANLGYFSPRPLSARAIPSVYFSQSVLTKSPALTPRGMRILPPIGSQNWSQRSPSTASARTPRADQNENCRNRDAGSPHSNYKRPATPNSTTQSPPMKKRSKGPNNDGSNKSYMCKANLFKNRRRFQVSEVLVSDKRKVVTDASDEEFFSSGSGEIRVIDNGNDQFDEIQCLS
ncbi:unnamed protein product [Orchesella dallaii]|uniref:Uncharacterized protein n=1 Tax=Orchesella dallaii TaxID=48710 RepID=A0ABP1RAV8_9HEXA